MLFSGPCGGFHLDIPCPVYESNTCPVTQSYQILSLASENFGKGSPAGPWILSRTGCLSGTFTKKKHKSCPFLWNACCWARATWAGLLNFLGLSSPSGKWTSQVNVTHCIPKFKLANLEWPETVPYILSVTCASSVCSASRLQAISHFQISCNSMGKHIQLVAHPHFS